MTDRTVCEHFNEIGKCEDCRSDYEARLRDEFAMAALKAIISLEGVNSHYESCLLDGVDAYRYADAMLEARKK